MSTLPGTARPGSPLSDAAADLIARERAIGARNYDPLPVVLAHGEGCWLTDVDGRRYLDLMSAYSAVSFGHAHPRIVGALVEQAQRLAVTSRAYPQRPAAGAARAPRAKLTGLDRALPANGGAEAVETALKAARKWGHKVKGIPDGRAEIIVCARQLPRPLDHHRRAFRPSRSIATASGRFRRASRRFRTATPTRSTRAITPNTAAFLVEPMQGEGGHRRAAGRLSRARARASAATTTCS